MTKRIDTDVFVVGTGPVGAVFARTLVPAGARVTMVDAGPAFSSRPGQNLRSFHGYQTHRDLFASVVNGLLHPLSAAPGEAHASLVNPRQSKEGAFTGAATAYCVGGQGTLWTGVIPRQHPKLERSDLLSDEEWDALYTESEIAMGKTEGLFDDSVRHSVIRDAVAAHYDERLEAGRKVGTLPMALRRSPAGEGRLMVGGADTVLEPLLDAETPPKGFEIREEHAVTRLHTEGGRITHAEGVDLRTGERFTAHAETFVIAAGTVLGAQLLHVSGIRPKALGRYLMEHPISFGQVALKDSLVDEIRESARFESLRASADPSDPLRLPKHDLSPNVWIPVGEGRPWHVQLTRDVVHFSECPEDVDERTVTDMRWYTLIEPREHHRVMFEDDLLDHLGLPRPTFDYRLDADNQARIDAMIVDQKEAANVLGKWVVEQRMLPTGACLHLQGATRMGAADDGTCVVDKNSRVWGFDNLVMAGNSVVPGGNACNPTLTAVALAFRAAHALAPK